MKVKIASRCACAPVGKYRIVQRGQILPNQAPLKNTAAPKRLEECRRPLFQNRNKSSGSG
jgi:hypothetical protein